MKKIETETADSAPLPDGAVTISGGFEYTQAVMAVKDGRVTEVHVANECTWWDDPDTTQTWAPEEGETLHVYGWRTNSDPVSRTLEDEDEVSLNPDVRTSQTWVRTVSQAKLMAAAYLSSIGAYEDAEDRRKAARAEISAQKRARYEAARERAELLYPYVGHRVFKAHIRWALEEGVAKAALALSRHAKWLAPHLRPLGGWPCHYRRIAAAWHKAYGWNSENELDGLMNVCSKISQPRLDSAWEVAKILAV
jgi:hypothetical protein